MTALEITSAQFALAADDDFATFARRVTETAHAASTAGSRVLVLPELVTTSLLAARPDREELRVADLDRVYREHFPRFTDEVIGLYREIARALDLIVVGGSHLRATDGGAVRNTCYVAFPDGRLVQQDKLHLTPAEQKMGVEPGEAVAVFEVDGVRAAVQICADIEFPEVPRLLAGRDVEVIFCPSLTWNTRGAERVRIGAHARAMENQMYVVVSPLVASMGYPVDGAIHGTGNARIAVPLDRTFGRNDGVWAQVTDTREGDLLHARLDFDLLRASRRNPEPPGLANVREDLYRRLGEQA
ncbi:nitrilase-related carbon-nitrogen hydrolase [Microbacterium sp.]|uniref:nitrilase-related carbon-nitrogen hydrolase n=1 Tax=Microbacterium sp. TaxID=51671 RepID=UPI00281275DC|nr:nitrilase-related carbon-nitrogen hydrolase [Microbacterium sp.]